MSLVARIAALAQAVAADIKALNAAVNATKGARAWVNFNGVGVVTIRAAFNVSSITDNGVGDYTINMPAGVMPDGYYAISGGGKWDSGANNTEIPVIGLRRSVAPTATAARILTIAGSTAGVFDAETVSVALHR